MSRGEGSGESGESSWKFPSGGSSGERLVNLGRSWRRMGGIEGLIFLGL